MIERIHSIRGIGKLKNVSASSHKFAPLTLIFGENGRGKSTFTQILNSLKTSDTTFIEKRKSDEQFIKIHIDGKDYTFESDNNWTENFSNIEVFDINFINENVVAGNHSSSEHRHGLANWIFGSERIILENQITALTQKINLLRDENNKLKPQLEIACTRINLADFLTLESIPDVEGQIKQHNSEIRTLNDLEKIRRADFFQQTNLPEFPSKEFKKLLETQLSDVADNAQLLVQSHLENHGNVSEDWLEIGFEEGISECPYCGQTINDATLLEAYQTYFSEFYKSLKNQVREFKDNLKNDVFDELTLSNNLSLLEKNRQLFEFWSNYREVSLKVINVSDVRLKIDQLEEEATKLLEKKSLNLLESIMISNEFQEAYDNYQKIVQKIEEYNEQVKGNNLILEEIKKVDIQVLPQKILKLEDLELVKKRFEPPFSELCNQYLRNESEISNNQKERTKLNGELKSTAKRLLEKYGKAVVKHLNDFLVGTTLNTETMKTNLQGKETFEFEFNINGLSYSSEEAFKYNLSEGDKSTVALAFFLARLDDMDLSESVIIFDDPMSSQDHNRRQETRYKILELCKKAKQVIVLSHDKYFLRELYRQPRWVSVDADTFYFDRIEDDDSSLKPCDILEMTKGEYYQDYEIVSNYLTGGVGDTRNVPTAIRRLVEENIRSRFPLEVKQEHSLGNIIQTILSTPTSKLATILNGRLTTLNRINDLTASNSHGGSSAPSDGDVRNCARLAIEIIETS